MNTDDKKGGLPLGGQVTTQEPLWELYDQLESIRLEASKSINPMVKARSAEKATPLIQELIRQMILRIKALEKIGGIL